MEQNQSSSNIFRPVIYALLIVTGLLIGRYVSVPFLFHQQSSVNTNGQIRKISDVINFIKQEYVDTVNEKQLVNTSITEMLQHLDPHSAFIPAEELKAANEPLEGKFEGIGIEFHLQQDTVMVVAVIPGGPSATVGMQAGDRIVKVNGKNFTGSKINNKEVMNNLRGEGGTKVTVSVYRRNAPKLIDFTITRGKIPIYSVEVSYMADAVTGYIRINRFGENTYDEYMDAFNKLKRAGMQQLIIDLRGNPGGYMQSAVKIADEFLPDGDMIVYTKGKARPREDYKASTDGSFEKGKMVIMMDEGSASASEILAGALQDWDRATIVGRRSFGKGLVQEQVVLPDSSAIRLTVARYYTPTGRSIQKSYSDGIDQYDNEVMTRYKHGELENADSIKFIDSLKYKTPSGRIVYGGGGIMPDVFVALDTTYRSDYYEIVVASGMINQFAYDYVDAHRSELNKFKAIDDYITNFKADKNLLNQFTDFTTSQKVKPTESSLTRCEKYLLNDLKAYIARQVFRDEGFYKIYLQTDKTFQKAVEVIHGNALAGK